MFQVLRISALGRGVIGSAGFGPALLLDMEDRPSDTCDRPAVLAYAAASCTVPARRALLIANTSIARAETAAVSGETR